jgi:hypothetical protein
LEGFHWKHGTPVVEVDGWMHGQRSALLGRFRIPRHHRVVVRASSNEKQEREQEMSIHVVTQTIAVIEVLSAIQESMKHATD